MKISVIVPVYNSEKYIRSCLDSILEQTHKDLEVILIDDGSTDKSGEICDEYQKKDSRIVVFHTQNGGVSHARNLGIKKSCGDFIAFVDSDDTIKPQMYEELLSVQSEFDVDIVTSDLVIEGKTVKNNLPENCIIDKSHILKSVLPSFTYENAIGTMAFTNKIFKKEVIKNNEIEFYEGFQFQEDLMFMINIYANTNSMYYLPKAFYEYIPHSSGLYTSYRKDGGVKFIVARRKMIELIEKYNIENINYNNFNSAFLYNITYYIYRTIDRVADRKECKKIIYGILQDNVVIECCREVSEKGVSFDRRIASAICSGNIKYAIFLIKLVRSGRANKLQKIAAKLLKRTV